MLSQYPTRKLRAFLAAWFVIAAVSSAGPAWAADLKPPAASAGVALDGKTAFAVPADALKLNPEALSVAAWVQVRNPSAAQVFLNCGQAGSVFTFYLYNNNVRMLVAPESGPYRYALAPPPAPDTWTHYAGTYDGKAIRVYMNGELKATTEAPGRMQKPAGRIFIGSIDEHERLLDGRLEDVRIWRRVLSDGDVAALAADRPVADLALDLAASWNGRGLTADGWKCAVPDSLVAARVDSQPAEILINAKDEGYRGIWYMNQPSGDEYVYKYSGGLGTYCANHIPHAWYAKEVNKTFFTYGGTTTDSNTRLIHMVSYYDHQTGMVPRPTILLDKQTSDAHDNPVINLDDKGTIWIFSSSHGTGRPSYISRSKKPYAIDEFELVWTGNFSYPQPWYIPGHGFLFMHTHYTGGRTNSMMTSPDGANWTERVFLSRIDQGHYQISSPWQNKKVGTAFNYHPRGLGLNYRTNLYYMETHDFGKTWQNVRGEPLEIMLTEVQNPALVHDYESEGLKVYTQDITYDAQGRPIIMYVTTKGYEPGPANAPRTWTVARWTGSEWEIHGGDIVSDNAYDFGSLYIESENLWRVIGPTEVGPQPYNPGGEIAMWTSRDQGRSWQKIRQMTADSPYNHTFVRRPVNAHPDFYGFWADGHGRQPSDSRLYFCNQAGDVFRLPVKMDADFVKPQRAN